MGLSEFLDAPPPPWAGGTARNGDRVHRTGVVRVTEGLAGPCQSSREPHQGALSAMGHYGVGIARTSTAPAGGAIGSPKGSPELRPPCVGMTPAPSQVRNTPHTARVQTHSPPVLHYLYARHPGHCHLGTAPSAHHTTPQHKHKHKHNTDSNTNTNKVALHCTIPHHSTPLHSSPLPTTIIPTMLHFFLQLRFLVPPTMHVSLPVSSTCGAISAGNLLFR